MCSTAIAGRTGRWAATAIRRGVATQMRLTNPGSLDVPGSTTRTVASGATLSQGTGDSYIGAGTILLPAGATFDVAQAASLGDTLTIRLNGSTAAISGAGTITMNGGTYTNTGSSSISPGASPGTLTIDGNAVLGAKTKTVIELGGRDANDNDVFVVTGRFAAGGTLAILPWLSFTAAAGDSFDVVSWGERTAMFHEIDGLDQFAGVALDPVFTDTGLTLETRAITLDGSDAADTLDGTDADDALVGRDGADVLNGGLGSDLLLGGEGDDILVGGAGADRLVGGHGHDTADFSAESGPVEVDLTLGVATDAADGKDNLVSIEELIGTVFNDALTGNASDNIIVGGGGADLMVGGEGSDTFVIGGLGDAGDSIGDFTSGEDILELYAAAFGLESGEAQLGVNFSVIAGAFDGSGAGDNAAFDAGDSALIYSEADHTLYFDSNGAQEGYTTVATLQPGAVLTHGDMRLTDHAFA